MTLPLTPNNRTTTSTKIIQGTNDVIDAEVVCRIPKLFWDSAGLSMVVTSEPVWRAVNELAKRGISLRYITDISGDNISYCKMMAENGIQLRHLDGIKSNFGINDRLEYLATVVMEGISD